MGFEKKVLNVVSEVTDTPAYFYNGTLFLDGWKGCSYGVSDLPEGRWLPVVMPRFEKEET